MYEELIAAREAELNRRASVLGAAWQAAWAEIARRAGGFLREIEGVQNGRASR